MNDTELRNSLMALHSASFAWTMSCCRDRDVAEEVLQSVYVKVLDGRASHAGRSSFRTWLFAVIRNAAVSHRRANRWSRLLQLDFNALAALPGVNDADTRQLDRDDEVSMIRNALHRLPNRQREVAHLVFYEELTLADAAAIMGISIGATRQHYARAKESLARMLSTLRDRIDESIAR